MSGFEKFKNIKKSGMQQEDINTELDMYYGQKGQNKTLRIPEQGEEEQYIIDYDADQLMQYYVNRNKDKEDTDFQLRTEYFFKNTTNSRAKETGFRALANERNNNLARYSQRYTNHYAYKRRRSANKAVQHYSDMTRKMEEYSNDDAPNSRLNSYEKYKHKEEIMKLRMKGMMASAEVKSKSDAHEDYLKGRAKLSCYMVLKDQLVHLMDAENNSQIKGKLKKKLTGLESDIKDAYNQVKKYSPKAQDEWKRRKGVNSAFYKEQQRKYKTKSPIFNMENTKLFTDLKLIEKTASSKAWPKQIVFKDRNQAFINKAEENRNEWNEEYEFNLTTGNADEVQKMEKEALERFNDMSIPTPKMLQNVGVYDYVMNNLREYYELTKMALPYYKQKLHEDGVVKQYSKEHPEFAIKLNYLDALDQYINFKLRADNQIQYVVEKGEGKFRIESDDAYRFYKNSKTGTVMRNNAFGYGQENIEFAKLEKAFKGMEVNLKKVKKSNLRNINDINKDINSLNLNILGDEDDDKLLIKNNSKEEDNHLGDWPGFGENANKIKLIDDEEDDKDNNNIQDNKEEKIQNIIQGDNDGVNNNIENKKNALNKKVNSTLYGIKSYTLFHI